MKSSGPRSDAAVLITMLCAGTISAQFVAGKATRDAFYLSHLDVTSLPTMVIVTSIVSIGLAVAGSRTLRKASPVRFVPAGFAVVAVLFMAIWGLVAVMPRVSAVALYMLISGIGPMLGSGFWLIVSERFDPRTAKRRFGQIAGAGTLGGLVGGLVAERVAAVSGVGTMLPLLAALNLLCAWLIRRFTLFGEGRDLAHPMDLSVDLAAELPRSGLRVLAEAPYLRNLAALVLLGTLGATLADYVFKAQAVASLGRGDELLRFFAAYYAGTSVLTFVVQTASSRLALEKLGLALTTGTPSLGLLVAGAAALLAPGLQSAMFARGVESVFRGSLFRAGYEVFYTPIPTGEKRAAKSLIDVGFDRLGDALGGAAIPLFLMTVPMHSQAAIMTAAIACSAVALAVATRLNSGYIATLERSLLNRAVELDLADVEDLTTRTIMVRTMQPTQFGFEALETPRREPESPAPVISGLDTDLGQIIMLRSRDVAGIRAVLRNDEGVEATLVPHIIPLLAWDPVSNDAVFALRKVAEERVGELVDALINPNQPFAVRRRLARVFSVCVSQRAVDGLMLGLDDQRFEVRFQCGRSLGAIRERNPRVSIDPARTFAVVLREVAVGRLVWESHRLLDQLDDPEQRSFVDEFVRGRTSQGLAHVFTLLALVLPAEPLQIAYRGLHTDDQRLRGTALEYLEGVLPAAVRERLWPFLEDPRPAARTLRPRDEILADLMRSHPSIQLNLEELQRKGVNAPWETTSNA